MRRRSEYWTELRKEVVESEDTTIAEWVYPRVVRHQFSEPGFVLIDLPALGNSYAFRRTMVALKRQLDAIHYSRSGHRLAYESLVRSDQQVTTKPHRDGGPEESILMLGYEPTTVASRLFIADYTQSAAALGIAPDQFLEEFNPMYASGRQQLADYTTQLEGVDPKHFQLLVINNSRGRRDSALSLGVLHHAVIDEPDPTEQRIVNSTMIAVVTDPSQEAMSAERIETFVSRDELSARV